MVVKKGCLNSYGPYIIAHSVLYNTITDPNLPGPYAETVSTRYPTYVRYNTI